LLRDRDLRDRDLDEERLRPLFFTHRPLFVFPREHGRLRHFPEESCPFLHRRFLVDLRDEGIQDVKFKI
jgi:hypothetical protein